MTKIDIRWKQRFSNFSMALKQLQAAVDLSKSRPLSELEKQGMIKAFEFTHEVSWNVLKDYFEYQGGGVPIMGSRDATREAFNKGIIEDGEGWMDMIKSRNQTSHIYINVLATEIANKITAKYFRLFKSFEYKMLALSKL